MGVPELNTDVLRLGQAATGDYFIYLFVFWWYWGFALAKQTCSTT
jgi:hypothetical protein